MESPKLSSESSVVREGGVMLITNSPNASGNPNHLSDLIGKRAVPEDGWKYPVATKIEVGQDLASETQKHSPDSLESNLDHSGPDDASLDVQTQSIRSHSDRDLSDFSSQIVDGPTENWAGSEPFQSELRRYQAIFVEGLPPHFSNRDVRLALWPVEIDAIHSSTHGVAGKSKHRLYLTLKDPSVSGTVFWLNGQYLLGHRLRVGIAQNHGVDILSWSLKIPHGAKLDLENESESSALTEEVESTTSPTPNSSHEEQSDSGYEEDYKGHLKTTKTSPSAVPVQERRTRSGMRRAEVKARRPSLQMYDFFITETNKELERQLRQPYTGKSLVPFQNDMPIDPRFLVELGD